MLQRGWIGKGIYTIFAEDIRATGVDFTVAARNAMIKLEGKNESNDSIDYKLQRWKLVLANDIVERCKIGAVVEIPKK